ncbi:MAG TPA: electron transport complex subunit RsxG [Xanthomonadales bacterium]|nr:electron transport complex subunit RsxG [Xanthomonadales bacterium]
MENKHTTNQQAPAWRSALALGLVAIIGTALLSGVNYFTRPLIEEQERRAVLEQLGQVIAPVRYNNDLHDDQYSFTDTTWFSSGQSITVYRARMDTNPVAAVFKLAATEGYNGKINLLIGINLDGSIAGVRVISHKETPGLGDAIEIARSDWVLNFDGKSLESPGGTGWAVKRDGGEFDQFTGATITPRAIVKTVKTTLEYFSARKETVFDHPRDAPRVTDQ